MTWKTCEGSRVLTGAEARLFAVAIPTIIDLYLDSRESFPRENLNYSCALICGKFESLTAPQKLTILEEAATGLLTETPVCPTLTDLNEGAIYYVYRWFQQQFEDDVEAAVEVWGKYILDAYYECYPKDMEESDGIKLTMQCDDAKHASDWKFALELLADRILWDRDFEEYQAGIPDPYFIHDKVKASRGALDRVYALCYSVAYPESKELPGILKENTTNKSSNKRKKNVSDDNCVNIDNPSSACSKHTRTDAQADK
jgi:hypothetical protein